MADKYDAMIAAYDAQQASSQPAPAGDKYDQMIAAYDAANPAPPVVAGPTQNGPSGLAADSGNAPSSFLGQSLFSNDPTGFAGGLLRGVPATVGGALAGPPGAMAGEALRQAGVNAAAVANGQPPASALSVLGQVGLAGAAQKVGDLAAPYLTRGAQYIGQQAGDTLKGTLSYLGQQLANIKPASYELAASSPEMANRIAGYVGKGELTGDALAQNVRSAIGSAVTSGEQEYADIAAKLSGPTPMYGPPIQLNLKRSISDALEGAARDFGYNAPTPAAEPVASKLLDQFGNAAPSAPAPVGGADGVRRVVDKRDVALFNDFRGVASTLDQATPQQIYFFQRDLNTAIDQNSDRPVAVALGRVKGAVNNFIENNAYQLPDLVQANKAYAAAKALEQQTSKLTGANDLLQHISTVYRSGRDNLQRQAIEQAAVSVPVLNENIQNARAFMAAQDFSPTLRSLPQTGMGAAIPYALGDGAVEFGKGLLTRDPITALGAGSATVIGAAMASPRIALGALRGANIITPAIEAGANTLGESASILSPLSAQAQALRLMSPESIAAYYRSPGQ